MKKNIFLILFFAIQITFTLAQSDNNSPLLNSLSVSPSSVNNGDSITVTINITDDFSGIDGNGFPGAYGNNLTQAIIVNPNGGQSTFAIDWHQISGNTYYAKAKIPAFAASGTWRVENLFAYDNAANYYTYRNGTDFNGNFQVISSTPDATAPILNSLSISPSTVNNGDSITIIINITDGVSGIDGNGFPGAYGNNLTQAAITNPNGSQSTFGIDWHQMSGNTYYAKAKIPAFAANGTWKVDGLFAYDNAGNYHSYENGTDFNGDFQVVSSTPDETAPILHSFSVSPASVNIGDSITITINITDGVSGIDGYGFPGAYGNNLTQAIITNPNGGQSTFAIDWHQISGNSFYARAEIPAFAANGTWKVDNFFAYDNAGNLSIYRNCSDFLGTFTVGPIVADNSAPSLTSVEVSPSTVVPGDSVTITVYMTDSESPVNGIGLLGYNSTYSSSMATIQNPGGTQTATNNIWKAKSCYAFYTKVKVPLNATLGTWTVENINAYDRAGNNQVYTQPTDYSGTFIVTNSTGITSNQLIESLNVYPNPTNGNITIDLDKINNISSIAVYNVLGEKVIEKRPLPNAFEETIEMGNLSKGIYSIVLLGKEGKKTVRVVKE